MGKQNYSGNGNGQTETTETKRQYIYRAAFYFLGLLVLAVGITLNTKAGLGVSPIISVSYSISVISGTNFGNMTLVLYSFFVVVEMALHIFGSIRQGGGAGKELLVKLLKDALQFPLSLVFTRFMNIFSALIPEYSEVGEGAFYASPAGRVLTLAAAVILTGIGAAASLNMRIVPNPGDGIVQAISDFTGKSVGFTKNCFDLFNVTLTVCIGFLFAGHIIGIGIGTLLAVVGVGRSVAAFNHLCKGRMGELAGVSC